MNHLKTDMVQTADHSRGSAGTHARTHADITYIACSQAERSRRRHVVRVRYSVRDDAMSRRQWGQNFRKNALSSASAVDQSMKTKGTTAVRNVGSLSSCNITSRLTTLLRYNIGGFRWPVRRSKTCSDGNWSCCRCDGDRLRRST